MKFGSKLGDVDLSAPAKSGGGRWLKTLKEGQTRMRFLQEIDEWVVYYEHYNPMGSSFPCTGERDTCPGCTSSNERMKSASRKVAVNALVGQYVDVYKLPVTLVNRLTNRAKNNGTITDRDYIITRIGKDKDTEYDIDTGNAMPVDLSAYELLNIAQMLEDQFVENWPDFPSDQPKQQPKMSQSEFNAALSGKTAPAPNPSSEPAPFEQGAAPAPAPKEDVEVTLDQLHAMTPQQLRDLCAGEGVQVPDELSTQQEIISWMEQQFA